VSVCVAVKKKKKKKNQDWLMSNPETWWICYSWVCRSFLNGACRSEWDSYLPKSSPLD
jgi:hypothetical protein